MRKIAWLMLGFYCLLTSCTQSVRERQVTPSVQLYLDVSYADDTLKAHTLDIYAPHEAKDAPVLLFIHGGDRGDKNYETLGPTFAQQDILVAVANYRSVPEFSHPAQARDVAKATAWLYQNIAQYGGNPQRLYLAGHSSGAVLAAMVGTDDRYLRNENLQASSLAGLIPISGLYDLSARDEWLLTWFGNDDEQRKVISPIMHTQQQVPPMLLLAGASDFEEAKASASAFADKLKENKNDASVHFIPNRDHLSMMREMVTTNDSTARTILQFIKADYFL